MRNILKQYLYKLFLPVKYFIKDSFEKLNPDQNTNTQSLFNKFRGHFMIIIILVILSLGTEILPKFLKKEQPKLSLDTLIPKGFVLIPIEIINGPDIIQLIGSHGVVDLYAYSDQSQVPEEQAASAVKVLPPDREEGRWTALVPENQISHLFSYSDPFYAVIQNPKKNKAKIYKKKEKKSLIVIEGNF